MRTKVSVKTLKRPSSLKWKLDELSPLTSAHISQSKTRIRFVKKPAFTRLFKKRKIIERQFYENQNLRGDSPHNTRLTIRGISTKPKYKRLWKVTQGEICWGGCWRKTPPRNWSTTPKPWAKKWSKKLPKNRTPPTMVSKIGRISLGSRLINYLSNTNTRSRR